MGHTDSHMSCCFHIQPPLHANCLPLPTQRRRKSVSIPDGGAAHEDMKVLTDSTRGYLGEAAATIVRIAGIFVAIINIEHAQGNRDGSCIEP